MVEGYHDLVVDVPLIGLCDLLVARREVSEHSAPGLALASDVNGLAHSCVLLLGSVNLKGIIEGCLMNQQSDLLCVVEHCLANLGVSTVEYPSEISGLDQASEGVCAVVSLNGFHVLNVHSLIKHFKHL